MGRPKGSKNKSNVLGRKDVALKPMKCSVYGCKIETMVDGQTESVICWKHVQMNVGIDKKFLTSLNKKEKKKSTGFPRGWHLRAQFVHEDGRVFEFGKEKKRLKGTLKPSSITVKTDERTKSQRRRDRDEKKLKKQTRLAKQYTKKKKVKRKR